MKVCQVCGARNADDAEFCESCGAYLKWDTQKPRRPEPARTRPAPPPPRQEFGVQLELTERPPTDIAPGQELRVAATVRNRGTVVDEFLPRVDAPVRWIRTEPERLSVYPGGEEPLTVVFAPPAGAGTPAGRVPYRVVVRSGVRPQVGATVDGAISVAPIDQLSAEIGPPTVYGRRRAVSHVLVRNDGNRPVQVAIGQPIRGSGVRADPYPPSFVVAPGMPVDVPVRLRTDRMRFFGQPVHFPYRLRVTPQTGSRPIDLDAGMLQKPLLPWVPRAAALVLPLIALVAVAAIGLGVLMLARAVQNGNNDDQGGQTPVPTAASDDPNAVVMPRLIGETVNDAQSRLDRLGLDSAVVRQANNAPKGTVLATDPPAGTRVPAGTQVRLLVSDGNDDGGNQSGGNDGGGNDGGGNDGGGNDNGGQQTTAPGDGGDGG